MTSLVGNAMPQFRLAEDDERALAVWMIDALRVYNVPTPMLGAYDYTNRYWPRSAAFLGDQSVDYSTLEAVWLHLPDITNGTNFRYGIIGVTRDVYGSPLGGVTVKLFLTATDLKVDQTISDASGSFTLSTPYYPDAHYLVEYKTGSPDVFGSSVNTLTGA